MQQRNWLNFHILQPIHSHDMYICMSYSYTLLQKLVSPTSIHATTYVITLLQYDYEKVTKLFVFSPHRFLLFEIQHVKLTNQRS